MTKRNHEWLAERFEENRSHLRTVAYRMLGSASEADDAVQESWLRLSRSGADGIENLSGWLTTVVARVCLDILRSRTSRREQPLETRETIVSSSRTRNPEEEALLADSVSLALMIVLDRLAPAERLAFVLHDLFAVPFEEIAPIIGRSEDATRQLASRARRRVQGAEPAKTFSDVDLRQQREIVAAFLSALRAGDFEGIVAVLDPNVVVHVDAGAGRPGTPAEIHGAADWARGAIAFAQAVSQAGHFVQPMLVDGNVGIVWAPGGKLYRALRFHFANGKIADVDIIAAPARLEKLDLAVLSS
jgi:RNA polymerase sigma-70 factor (ECF subfamily)